MNDCVSNDFDLLRTSALFLLYYGIRDRIGPSDTLTSLMPDQFHDFVLITNDCEKIQTSSGERNQKCYCPGYRLLILSLITKFFIMHLDTFGPF